MQGIILECAWPSVGNDKPTVLRTTALITSASWQPSHSATSIHDIIVGLVIDYRSPTRDINRKSIMLANESYSHTSAFIQTIHLTTFITFSLRLTNLFCNGHYFCSKTFGGCWDEFLQPDATSDANPIVAMQWKHSNTGIKSQLWWFDWSFAHLNLIAPVVTITGIILSSNKIQNGDILVPPYTGCPGKWPKTSTISVTNWLKHWSHGLTIHTVSLQYAKTLNVVTYRKFIDSLVFKRTFSSNRLSCHGVSNMLFSGRTQINNTNT